MNVKLRRGWRETSPRQMWKRAYRMARQPDTYLADPVIIDFPVRILLYAIECAQKAVAK